MTNTHTDRTTERHPAQYLALAIGAIYTLVGLAGFLVTGFDGFAAPEGELLLGMFEVNPLHNIVHLLIGLAGLALWNRADQAKTYGWLLAIGYGAAFVYGLFVAGQDTEANFLALNGADQGLHLVSALAGLALALWISKDEHDTTGTTTHANRDTTVGTDARR